MPSSDSQAPPPFRCGATVFDFAERTHVMGVLNVTPDSFSDGGRYLDPDAALRHADSLVEAGADILDVGGESSRPAGPYGDGAVRVPVEEEIRRTVPVIEAVVKRFDVPVSIDTVKSSVARAAVDAGASAINDISALRTDPAILEVAVSAGASLFLMHMKGTPGTMQKDPLYDDLIGEICAELSAAARTAREAGIPADRIALDPGLGFGKTYDHNYEIIRHLGRFADLGYALLVGPSRKTFVGVDFALPPGERDEGSLAAFALCAAAGAHVVRAHDVRGARRALFVADRLTLSGPRL